VYPPRIQNISSKQLLTCPPFGLNPKVNWLLQHLQQDPRKSVQSCAMQNLLRLADKSGHLWPPACVLRLTTITREATSVALRRHGFGVIHSLLQSPFAGPLVFPATLLEDIAASCEIAYVVEPTVVYPPFCLVPWHAPSTAPTPTA